MSGSSYKAFREKLDAEHKWPAYYMFKFIVPREKESEIYSILPKEKWSSKASKSGTYLSFTAKILITSSDEVIEMYEKAHEIEGIIAL